MKRLIVSILAVCVLAAICLVTGYQKTNKQFQTACQLEEAAVVSALECAGLSGKISESETISDSDEYRSYVVRSESETYSDVGGGVIVASATSAIVDGQRVLSTLFDQKDVEKFAWADWKRQIIFATLLYGGFEHEDDVYQAFCEKELPDRSPFVWDASLPEGYCKISLQPRRQKKYNEDGYETQERSAILRVNIYESYELYQSMESNRE